MKVEQEVEVKFDLENRDPKIVFQTVTNMLTGKGYAVGNFRNKFRNFKYFDNSKLELYHAGATLREVTLFEEGKFRYDYKTGSVDNRVERSIVSAQELGIDDVVKQFELDSGPYFVETVTKNKYLQADFKGCAKFELSCDYVKLDDSRVIKELELEYKSGCRTNFGRAVELVKYEFGFDEVKVHKYQRIIDLRDDQQFSQLVM